MDLCDSLGARPRVLMVQDHLLCLLSLRPSLALLNGLKVTEEDRSESQRWADDQATATPGPQPYTGFRQHVNEARKAGEERPSLTPTSINFDGILSGERPYLAYISFPHTLRRDFRPAVSYLGLHCQPRYEDNLQPRSDDLQLPADFPIQASRHSGDVNLPVRAEAGTSARIPSQPRPGTLFTHHNCYQCQCRLAMRIFEICNKVTTLFGLRISVNGTGSMN
jgi:hypothetical protein